MATRRVPEATRRLIFKRDEVCQACFSDERLVIDHIKPWADGGTHDPSNLQVLCRPCNARKNRRPTVEAPCEFESYGDRSAMSLVGVRLDAGMISQIDAAADASHRNRSEMVRRLLIEAVDARRKG
jgi:hypothetical protein